MVASMRCGGFGCLSKKAGLGLLLLLTFGVYSEEIDQETISKSPSKDTLDPVVSDAEGKPACVEEGCMDPDDDSLGRSLNELKAYHNGVNVKDKIDISTETTAGQESLDSSTLDDQQYSSEKNEEGVKNGNNRMGDSEIDNIDSEEVTNLKTDKVMNDSDSLILKWIKYFLDPVLEEFKDGMYSNSTEFSNKSSVNDSDNTVNGSHIDLSNVTEPAFINISDSQNQNISDSKKVKFDCVGRNVTENTTAEVKLVNSTRLLQMLSFDKNKNDTENVTDCLLVMFFAPWCHFCAKTAPHYNALARAFPQLDFVAVDTAQFSNLLARFGTVSVPNVLIFHQSRAAVKFNQTERVFDNFVSFVKNVTGLEPNSTVNVTDKDYEGPVPSIPTDDPDYLLWLSWLFVLVCSSYMFVTSNRGQQWITRVRVLWQEHQHID